MRLKLSSNLFNRVSQPGTYHGFSDHIEGIEQRENEYHDSDECMYIDEHEQGQLSLFPRTTGDYDQNYLEHRIQVPNPDWKPGHYEMNYRDYCIHISKIWVDKFIERCNEIGVQARIKYTGIDMPREYNFADDCALFTFDTSREKMDKIFNDIRYNYKDVFPTFLYDNYKSYDGFFSFLSHEWHDWLYNITQATDTGGYEHAVWQALHFYLWKTNAEAEEWSRDYEEAVYDNDGCYSYLEFVEDEPEEEVI